MASKAISSITRSTVSPFSQSMAVTRLEIDQSHGRPWNTIKSARLGDTRRDVFSFGRVLHIQSECKAT